MPTKILGVHDGHDAAAALVVDGRVEFAIEEERLTRRKNHWGTPVNAIRHVLEQTGTDPSQLDHIALAGNYEVLHADPAAAILGQYPGRRQSPLSALNHRFRQIARRNDFVFGIYSRRHARHREQAVADLGLPAGRMVPVEHHTCHAAAAYYSLASYDSPVLVLTCDGSGDRLCASVAIGRNGALERIAQISDSDSVGRIYGLITYVLGMKPLEHEYKVMGLAPYGGEDEARSGEVYRSLSAMFEVNPANPLIWTRRRGAPPVDDAGNRIARLLRYQRFDHVAASVQAFLEDLLTAWVRSAIEATGIHRLALSGGVFMNVKLNQLILAMPEVDELFVMPSCGDESNAAGAAFYVHANQSGNGATTVPKLGPLYWGGEFTAGQCRDAVEKQSFSTDVRWTEEPDIDAKVAELLSQGEVVARHAGRMEFGARALGNRSILAPPADRGVVQLINDMIKQRDFWMPFAPSVAAEAADGYYTKPKPMPAPYMIVTFDAAPDAVSSFIAATHPKDGTTRPQEVYAGWNPAYHRLITEVGRRTGHPIVLNTSFNLHGYPIVYSPEDAIDVFDRSGLRHLALGPFLLSKK